MEVLDEDDLDSATDADSVLVAYMGGKLCYDTALHFTPKDILNNIPRAQYALVVFRKSLAEINEYFEFNRCVLNKYNEIMAVVIDVDCARWPDFRQLYDQKVNAGCDMPLLSLHSARRTMETYGCDFETIDRTLSKDNVKFPNQYELYDSETYKPAEQDEDHTVDEDEEPYTVTVVDYADEIVLIDDV